MFEHTDTERLDWVLDVISCSEGKEIETDNKTMKIMAALLLGKSGRDAIDTAMDSER